jgi:hypothetical protein
MVGIRQNRPQLPRALLKPMASMITYAAQWQIEVVQSTVPRAWSVTAWSYEDLASDWLGVMAFPKYGGNLRKIADDCGMTEKRHALELSDKMEQYCNEKKQPCHRDLKVKVASPTSNPLAHAILFHAMLSGMGKCCQGAPPAPATRKDPSDLYQHYGLDRYVLLVDETRVDRSYELRV